MSEKQVHLGLEFPEVERVAALCSDAARGSQETLNHLLAELPTLMFANMVEYEVSDRCPTTGAECTTLYNSVRLEGLRRDLTSAAEEFLANSH